MPGYENFTLPVTMTKALLAWSMAEDTTRINVGAIVGHAIASMTTTSIQVLYGNHDNTHKITGVGFLLLGKA